jgi:hypothetical protein
MKKSAVTALAIFSGVGLLFFLARRQVQANEQQVEAMPFPGEYYSPIPLMDRTVPPEHWETQIARRIAFYPDMPDMPENTRQAAPTQYP